jgi:cephalosporin hydroxylase
MQSFEKDIEDRISANLADQKLRDSAAEFMQSSIAAKYSYNFTWLGRPIIQYPQDVLAMQELIAKLKPDLIIETGIAHGGSVIFSASMLELNAVCGGPADAEVLAIDVDIRAHNRAAIESHPLFKRVTMIEGSSVAPDVIAKVSAKAAGKRQILVCLDSNHTHEHVLAELDLYAPFVSRGSYCVVFDTIVEDLPATRFSDRPWGPGNNPKTAVHAFLEKHPEFEIDERLDGKLLISVAPSGYLKRVR